MATYTKKYEVRIFRRMTRPADSKAKLEATLDEMVAAGYHLKKTLAGELLIFEKN